MGSPRRDEDRPRRRGRAPEPDDGVPEPTLLLMGCAPFVRVEPAPCPTCGSTPEINRVEDRPSLVKGEPPTIVACLRCDRRDDRWEAILANRRHTAGPGRERGAKADRKVRHVVRAARRQGVKLSEVDRRRIWCGNKRSMLAAVEGLANLAAAGRVFLAAVGQLPDWDLILDRRGKVVGRWSRCDDAAASASAIHALNLKPDDQPSA